MTMRGSCLCGDVAFEVDRLLEPLQHCHCSMCRKAHGAPFVSFASAPASGFRWLRGEGSAASYAASPSITRTFCRRCGSSLPIVTPGADRVSIPLGLLVDAPALDLATEHVFVESKAAWYEIPDEAPQHAGYPPGSGEEVDWGRKTEPTAEAVRGGCLCGAVAYEAPRPLSGTIIMCHCSRCRRARAAAHNANLFLAPDRFRWLRGEEQLQRFKVPEAERFAQVFCKVCGSPMPSVGSGRVVLPAGSLDDDPGIRPAMHIFVGSKAAWFELSGSLPRHEAGPPGGPPPVARS